MYRAAMQCMVSELVRQDRLLVIESLELAAPKTKLLIGKLAEFGLKRAVDSGRGLRREAVPCGRKTFRMWTWMAVSSLDPLELDQARQGIGHGRRV